GGSGNCDPDKVYFEQQVLPILISNCAMSGCHDNASHQDGVILTSYQTVMATADVRPGRPENSDLYEVIIDTDLEDRMPRPPQAPLQQDQIALIRKWIEQGALDLTCNSGCDTTQFTYTATIKPIIVNYCQGCHNGTAAQGGIDLSTYNGVKTKIDDGRLWGAINHLPGYSPMPKNGNKLADCEITQIRKWIEAGSPNN
ncbi:MAG TPA: c-type cytochrome, partial [Chitinophagaceae bacterium]|nr:c-type cytochrome [Chitinophagaceae bacterium]